MPIHVKRDLKKLYGFGTRFSLKDIPGFVYGSVLDRVRNEVADANWDEFHKDYNWTIWNAPRDVSKTLGKKFNVQSQADEAVFDDLWRIVADSRDWAKNKKWPDSNAIYLAIEEQVQSSYGEIAFIAQGGTSQQDSFKREHDLFNKDVVVFSDHHMSAFKKYPNYFDDLGNYSLYLEVLHHYMDLTDFTIVENGDVEEGLVYEPDATDAAARVAAYDKRKLPILDNADWAEFNGIRDAKRVQILNDIIAHYESYYDLLANEIIPSGRYIKISGNHDTYLNNDLRNIIQGRLNATIHDVLRVNWSNQCKYIITHGHQFDEACVQPYAASIGEIISEGLSWAYQGADRAWNHSDTKKWYNSTEGEFQNKLVSSHPAGHYNDADMALVLDIQKDIRNNPNNFFEALFGHPVAWEYFENRDAFNAVFLEVYTGEEMYKLRHMNEIKLYDEYVRRINLDPVPILVLGHTHEVRYDAAGLSGSSISNSPGYINTGSAGRFANLIWCAELTATGQCIVSWSEVNGRLKKITWKNDHGILKHDLVTWINK
ncbi:MAG: hypothetical protein WKI04_14285 [Ferruginibacter sp.]